MGGRFCILLVWLKSTGFLLDPANEVAYILNALNFEICIEGGFTSNHFLEQNFGDSKMANGVTVRSVERLAQQLPPAEQLVLISRLSQRLSGSTVETFLRPKKKTGKQVEEERRRRAEKLLAEMDAVAEKFHGKSNVVAEIRRMRKQRDKQIWKNVSTPM
jgi:hypothetical protein